jgi:chromosome partitioning protein
MAIAVYGGQKGGSGKSTQLVNHAVMLQEEDGDDILLVDTDPQGSTQDFVATRNENEGVKPLNCIVLEGKDIANQLRALKGRYKHILVDCVGSNTVEMRLSMTVADMLITPCRPARFDSNTMVNVNQTIEDSRIVNPALRAFVVINFASPNMNERYQKREQRLRDFIKEYCPNYEIVTALAATRLKHYDCADYGLALHELPDPDEKANEEMRAIFEEIWHG